MTEKFRIAWSMNLKNACTQDPRIVGTGDNRTMIFVDPIVVNRTAN